MCGAKTRRQTAAFVSGARVPVSLMDAASFTVVEHSGPAMLVRFRRQTGSSRVVTGNRGFRRKLAWWPRRTASALPFYHLPYRATRPRHSASRSRAKLSLPRPADLAAAVITRTSFNSGSTKTDWP
jgi:hypothetical protein